MWIVVNDKVGRVYGMFDTEEQAISWAKLNYRNIHSKWWVEKVSPAHMPE